MLVKIGAFSDCHNPSFLSSPGIRKFILDQDLDIFIFAGDFCLGGFKQFQLNEFGQNLKGLAKNVIFVPGNHDFLRADARTIGHPLDYNNRLNAFDRDSEYNNFKLLQDTLGGVIVMGYDQDSFYHKCVVNGVPVVIAANSWVKMPDDRWAFCAKSDEALLHVASKFEYPADILITHAPPYCPLGEYRSYGKRYNLGDSFMTIQAQKVVHPKLWFCGHVHESYGSYYLDSELSELIKFGVVAKPNDRAFLDAVLEAYQDMPSSAIQAYNVSLMGANYSLENKIIFTELEL